jgi:hypothetical protein
MSAYPLTKTTNDFYFDLAVSETLSYSYSNGVYNVGANYTNNADLNRIFGFIFLLTPVGNLDRPVPFLIESSEFQNGETLASVLARIPAPTQETTVADSANTISLTVAFENQAGMGAASASFVYEAVPSITSASATVADKLITVSFVQVKAAAHSEYQYSINGSTFITTSPSKSSDYNFSFTINTGLVNKTAYPVSLKAKNSEGVWSEPFSVGTFTPTKLVAPITVNSVMRNQNTNTVKITFSTFADLENTSLPTKMKIIRTLSAGAPVEKMYNITSIVGGVISATEIQ